MTETITAIYEKGVLRPLQPLDLREQQRVRIQVVPDKTEDEGDAAIRVLVVPLLAVAVRRYCRQSITQGLRHPLSTTAGIGIIS